MISLHPSRQQLVTFVAGEGDPLLSLMISAHVDMCSACRQKIDTLQSQISEEALAAQSDTPAFAAMLAHILEQPLKNNASQRPDQTTIELDGRLFPLPRALHRQVAKAGNWSHLLGKVWQAPVDLGTSSKAHFIFMEKGGSVPEHTHRGKELTLVLDGQFNDGLAEYDSGDFIQMDSSHQHTPHAHAEEGCLVFSVVDQPLHFTSGIARLLNPFSHLFF